MKHLLLLCLFFFGTESYLWSQNIQKLKQQLDTTSLPQKKVALLNQLSEEYRETDPSLAVFYGKEAAALAQELQDSTALGNAYNNISVGYFWIDELAKASAYTYKALAIRERQRDLDNVAGSYNTLGIILNGQKKYEKALQYFQRALVLGEQVQSRKSILTSLSNIGTSYENLQQPQKALHYYLRVYEMDKQDKDTFELAVDELNIGNIYRVLKQPQKASRHLTRALVLSLDMGNKVNAMYAYRCFALLYKDTKQFQKGIEAAQKSLTLSQKLNSPDGGREAALLLNDLYLTLGNYKQAHQYLTLAAGYQDTLHLRNQNKSLTEMNIKYETERKEKENLQLRMSQTQQEERLQNESMIRRTLGVLLLFMGIIAFMFYRRRQQTQQINLQLREKNELISQKNEAIEKQTKAVAKMALQMKSQNQELDSLNKQKNTLFSIIAHDLRGPLISLRSLLKLMHMGALPPDKLEKFIKDLDTQQQNSLELLDNLLMWARSQMDGLVVSPKPLHLFQVVRENLQLLEIQAERKNIMLFNQVAEGMWVIADFEMTKLVFRNLISNAIKFCSTGDIIQISAQVEPEEEIVLITVKDTGMGISDEDQLKLFKFSQVQKRGTAQERGSGLGLMLCREFIEKNQGRIWVESKEGMGSTFYFTLPYTPVPVPKKKTERAS